MNRLSKIYRPFSKIINERCIQSKSEKLMVNYGFIRRSADGLYYLLPMGLRVLEKLTKLIDNEMSSIGAQKMSSPLLTEQSVWQKSGTTNYRNEELYTVTDRSRRKFILSPTHEEAFTELLTQEKLSYDNFPLLLYQITPKFRDEDGLKLSGLLRSREFIMKDLYSFHNDQENAREIYMEVKNAYKRIFDSFKIPYYITECDANPHQGSIITHEYHYICDSGNDKLYICEACKHTSSVIDVEKDRHRCSNCSIDIKKDNHRNGIEIAHTFNFGTKYSNDMKCNYTDRFGAKKLLHMCSYGIGLSRLIAACIEVLSTQTHLRLPSCIAPYSVCVIPEDSSCVEHIVPGFYSLLQNISNFRNDVIIDDRWNKSFDVRIKEAKSLGIPFIMVARKCIAENIPIFELHDLNEDKENLMSESAALQYLVDNQQRA